MPKLSVIIPTLNEEKYLPRLLESLSKQTFKNFEIIIVDGNSKDRTREVVRQFNSKLNLSCIVTKKRGIGLARNLGVKKSKGELLLFLDADVVLPMTFIFELTQNFLRAGLGVATCYIKPNSSRISDKIIFLFANLLLLIDQFISPVAPGFCIMCKREVFYDVGGFDEKIEFAEDVNFVERASKISKFRVINTKIIMSVRRLDKEGRAAYLLKYVYAGIKRKLVGEITSEVAIDYKFGDY